MHFEILGLARGGGHLYTANLLDAKIATESYVTFPAVNCCNFCCKYGVQTYS